VWFLVDEEREELTVRRPRAVVLERGRKRETETTTIS